MSQLAEKIGVEIAKSGAIPFQRFMELALYCPNHGFYERKEDSIGDRGDYYTSVSVGSLFGELLAWQFAEWLTECLKARGKARQPESESGPESPGGGNLPVEGAGRVDLAEAGAHRGELARDLLNWLRQMRPEVYAVLEYSIVEPSARRQEWQRETLREFGSKVRWVPALSELRPHPIPPAGAAGRGGMRGVLFCNELLDAMPVRRWGWDAQARQWFEWGVTLKEDKLLWVRLEPRGGGPGFAGLGSSTDVSVGNPSTLNPQLSTLFAALPDGFTLETNPAAEAWWREAAGVLECGRLVTLDYGLTAEELFAPERPAGTLRAYRGHQVGHDVLADPGEQDLTAHVNFTEIEAAGESAGLRTEVLTTQEQFLSRVAARIYGGKAPFGEWTAVRTGQLRRLTHPEHLGRAFKVLVQARG